MKVLTTDLPGVLIQEPQVFSDARGFFLESYHQKKCVEAGLPPAFVQDNHSRSHKNVLRGLHAQLRRPQGKLVRIIQGEVFDVIVDIRPGSATFKKWIGVNLSATPAKQVYIPPGYAHGFCVLSDAAEMLYKVTDFYDAADELHLIWNDPDIGIQWPLQNPVLSAKDAAGVRLRDIVSQLPSLSR